MADSSDGYKILSDNRQTRFQYEILESFEAGLELKHFMALNLCLASQITAHKPRLGHRFIDQKFEDCSW